jgi:hypothetical protein
MDPHQRGKSISIRSDNERLQLGSKRTRKPSKMPLSPARALGEEDLVCPLCDRVGAHAIRLTLPRWYSHNTYVGMHDVSSVASCGGRLPPRVLQVVRVGREGERVVPQRRRGA